MDFADRHVTAAPEGMQLDFVLAGLGSRFLAYSFDLLLQTIAFVGVAYVVEHFVGSGTSTRTLLVAGGLALFAFVDFIGYFVFFEVFFGGGSPGKRLAGLRVVRVEGQAVGFLHSLLRNVLRLVDWLPSFYFLGIVLILTTPRNQRLGDVVGGTIVIRERVAATTAFSSHPWSSGAQFAAPAWSPATGPLPGGQGGQQAWLPPELWNWDVSAVPAQELALVRTFLSNRDGYTPAARQKLAIDLANRIWPSVSGPSTPPPPEAFLEMVARVKAARG